MKASPRITRWNACARFCNLNLETLPEKKLVLNLANTFFLSRFRSTTPRRKHLVFPPFLSLGRSPSTQNRQGEKKRRLVIHISWKQLFWEPGASSSWGAPDVNRISPGAPIIVFRRFSGVYGLVSPRNWIAIITKTNRFDELRGAEEVYSANRKMNMLISTARMFRALRKNSIMQKRSKVSSIAFWSAILSGCGRLYCIRIRMCFFTLRYKLGQPYRRYFTFSFTVQYLELYHEKLTLLPTHSVHKVCAFGMASDSETVSYLDF